MKVLFVASEVAPFSKTGGLADVAGALPRALAARDVDMLTVSPLWPSVPRKGLKDAGALVLQFPFGSVRVRVLQRDGFAFLEHPGFFGRDQLYGATDDARRFAVLSTAALSAAQLLGFAPDIVHLNDWQTGLAALALARGYSTSAIKRARCVFTIHNLAYAGAFSKDAMAELGLPWDLFTESGVEFYDQLSFLKAGLVYADALTTVSPTYAREIQTVEGGQGFHGLLQQRAADLQGILNGIDTDEWNPQTDVNLPAHFSAAQLSGKQACARALLEHVKLPGAQTSASRAPIFGTVGRLAEQKGIELLVGALPVVLERGAHAVVVGSGEERYAEALRALSRRYPLQLAIRIGFDEKLAHLVEAGADFFVMPSKFEPCGLNQMYALRYGTVPIVRAVGGLEDTVVDLAQPNGTGIKFRELSIEALEAALRRALELFESPVTLKAVQQRGMAQDHSWGAAAQRYEALYESIVSAR